MIRHLFVLAVCAALLALSWLRSPGAPTDDRPILHFTPLPLAAECCRAGPLKLTAAWELVSSHGAFGGYSALLRIQPGRLLALSDRGYFLEFSEPGAPFRPPHYGATQRDMGALKSNRDIEAAAWDAPSGRLWLALEGRNAVARYRPDMTREAFREIPEWKKWSNNGGPESMVRLADGRFVVICECRTTRFGGVDHPAYLFSEDPSEAGPAKAFTFRGVEGYRPTDMARLPDGRVLILARRLNWPLPPSFSMKVLIADPAEIATGGTWQAREIADLSAPWPVDNYEGLAIERMADGTLLAWIISDENEAITQRVLLLRVVIDETALPEKQKAPGSPGRP
jgi:Esterase-like activity of phytase